MNLWIKILIFFARISCCIFDHIMQQEYKAHCYSNQIFQLLIYLNSICKAKKKQSCWIFKLPWILLLLPLPLTLNGQLNNLNAMVKGVDSFDWRFFFVWLILLMIKLVNNTWLLFDFFLFLCGWIGLEMNWLSILNEKRKWDP